MRINLYLLQILFCLPFIISCQSKDGDFTIFSPEDDLALGKKIDAQISIDTRQFPVLERTDYPQLYNHLDRIKESVINSPEILHRDEFAWEIKVVQNDTIYNAFCTPGGYIYIFTGLIRFVKSEDELAGILGHEIAHGDLRHSTDQMTKALGLRAIVTVITGGESAALADIGLNLLGLQFSRNDEREADEYAVKYLSDTDYNPRAFSTFFKRMKERDANNGYITFLSTHPDPGNRVEEIDNYWRENGSKKGKDHSENFKSLLESLPY
jgi:predicted Zn-dependent protease